MNELTSDEHRMLVDAIQDSATMVHKGRMNKIPMLEKFAAQSLVEYDGELIFSKEKFAQLIVGECIDKIETHRIPVGNSAAGEMACEMTYSALMEIRDEIKEHFGVEE